MASRGLIVHRTRTSEDTVAVSPAHGPHRRYIESLTSTGDTWRRRTSAAPARCLCKFGLGGRFLYATRQRAFARSVVHLDTTTGHHATQNRSFPAGRAHPSLAGIPD